MNTTSFLCGAILVFMSFVLGHEEMKKVLRNCRPVWTCDLRTTLEITLDEWGKSFGIILASGVCLVLGLVLIANYFTT